MEDNRTPQHDGSDQYSKKAATSSKPTLTSNPRANRAFAALFGPAPGDELVTRVSFFGLRMFHDRDDPANQWISGQAVRLEEVA